MEHQLGTCLTLHCVDQCDNSTYIINSAHVRARPYLAVHGVDNWLKGANASSGNRPITDLQPNQTTPIIV